MHIERLFASHNPSGEMYVLELTEGQITGVCGPLHHSEIVGSELDNYDVAPDDAAWAETQRWTYREVSASTNQGDTP